ncbi:tol-pal system-associated acyl-CoA thioesterase [Oceaniglobus ichthyenteri]|uniref:tol-pal system-associated acyl-CoA thioesterase n=1 Tax=Oceaniglobus ichthyenteri TaxID=2136177 RepID=UPI000D33ADF8|nr:tol-pal system-associated acyl-CoA thioesterase [Oceaniglobus ichthyenteri]
MMHQFSVRVYYEDTDMAGIVYYANYLKYIERARSDWVRELGIDQGALRDAGQVFAVARIEADYVIPARFDDALQVQTRIVRCTGARLVLAQDVCRDGQVVFAAQVTLVALDRAGRATRLPAEFRRAAGQTT